MLILVRHGERAWNAADRFAGWADILLTPARSFGVAIGRSRSTCVAPWWKSRTRKTGSAVNATPCSLAVRYVVRAISATSHSRSRTILRKPLIRTGSSAHESV